jgi:hypothetical protein
MADEASVLADETYYDVASRRLDEQIQRSNSLDAKVSTVFGFSAAILPLFGAILALSKTDRPHSAQVLYLVAIGVYVVLLVFVYLAYQVTNFSLRPDLDTLRTHSGTYEDRTMRAWVANECLKSIATNEPRLKTKTWRIAWALRLLAIDAFLLALAAFLAIRW